MVLEQINTDENKENISVNELRDAIKPGGFLDSENKNYEENIKSVWDLLNNSEQLSEIDKALIESLKSVLNDEKEKIKSGNIVTAEDKNLLKVYIDLLWENDQEVQELEELIALYNNDINEESSEINPNNEIIINNFENLPEQDKNLLINLKIWLDLINNIDCFLDKWEIDLSKKENIKAVNILNNIIKDDPERYEKLSNIVKRETIEMSHEVNVKIAKNDWKVWDSTKQERITVWNIDYYNAEQKMLIQLWANVCYWENLEIDWCRWNKKEELWEMLFSFNKKTENQKLTSIYLYRLEIITRQDVMDYRQIEDKLLSMPELDDILNTLSREEQNEVMEEFLWKCFLRVRMGWMHFEDLIWSDYFRRLLILLVKTKTEWDISIEQWIEDRQNLIKSLWDLWNEEIIKNIQEEIASLSIKNLTNWKYVFKTMWEYYQSQVDDLEKTINAQNRDNVDIEKRQHAQNEAMDILIEFQFLLGLSDLVKTNELSENWYKWQLMGMISKLATLYNNADTPKYREWIENWEIIDLYVVNNIAVQFKKHLTPKEQNNWWQDFLNFMNKCSKQVAPDINKCSNTLDMLYQVESAEVDRKNATIEPTFWKPWAFLDTKMIDFYRSNAWQSCRPPEMWDLSNIDVYGEPTSYKLQLWEHSFEWWLWVKDIYDKAKAWEMNIIITKPWIKWSRVEVSWPIDVDKWDWPKRQFFTGKGFERLPARYQEWFSWELCKYEEHDWEIWLYKFGPNWELPSQPTQIITNQDIVHSNLAMTSAMESIDTEDFNNVMKEFNEEELWTFAEIQKSIESLVGKYNRENLSHDDVKDLRKEIWTMLTYIDNIPVEKLKELRSVLDGMKWDKSKILNPYEQEILWRIYQIDALLTIHDDPSYRNYLFKLWNLESNNDRYEQVDWEAVVGIIWSIAAIIACIIIAAPSWWTSLTGAAAAVAAFESFLACTATTVAIKTTTYFIQQDIRSARNFRQASDKIAVDRYWNEITIPWYLAKEDMSSFYKYSSWEISLGEHLWNIASDLWPIVAESVQTAIKWFIIWQGLWQISKWLKMGYDFYRKGKSYYGILTSLFAVGITTEVVFTKWTASNTTEVDVMKDIDNYLDTLIPKKLRSWSQENETELMNIFSDITCKSMDDSWNLSMEYNPDNKNFKSLLKYYEDAGGIITKQDDWTIIVEHNGKTLTLCPSKTPASYRKLSAQDKEALENVWWIDVDHSTWEITYKNPEGLKWLRALWVYMQNSWQWEVFIGDNHYAKVMFLQPDWWSSVVTVQPSKT